MAHPQQLCSAHEPARTAFKHMKCSLPYDSRLYADDIDASKAYAEALHRAGILNLLDCERIVKGFELVRLEWLEGRIRQLCSDEDVHMINERRLVELIGELGDRLGAGRSRNEQIATDLKLWLRKGVREIIGALRAIIETSVDQAEKHIGILMPGYTHMQHAQTVQFSHWILSHAWALRDDCTRLTEVLERSNVLPLGSGALAGNSLGLDRSWLAQRLGFASITQNSMHAVGDRDFIIDFVYCCSMISLHLSRLAEDLILYATKEFDFVRLSDKFTAGSSLMPHKSNPESLELVRATSASITSSLMALMMTIKATPSAYNKDLQFSKLHCFSAYDMLQNATSVTRGILATMHIHQQQMEAIIGADMLATDWASYLVRRGVPFRQAHDYIAAVILHAKTSGKEITEIPLGELQQICPHFGSDILKFADHGVNIEMYKGVGGTSTKSIVQQISALKLFVQNIRKME